MTRLHTSVYRVGLRDSNYDNTPADSLHITLRQKYFNIV